MHLTEVGWFLADGYCLQGFAYHDGTIPEFSYARVLEGISQQRDLLLKIANLQDETVQLRFSGVEVLRVTELWEGSIVNAIHVARLSDPVAAQLPLQKFWRNLLWNEADVRKLRLTSRFNDHLAVVLISSYGCEFSLLCERLHVSKMLPLFQGPAS